MNRAAKKKTSKKLVNKGLENHMTAQVTSKDQLSSQGMSRAKTILPFLPFKKTTLYEWSADGRFPSPVKLSPTLVAWRNSDVLAWLGSSGVISTNKDQLSSQGMSRAKTILPFLPFTSTTLYEWSKDGRFPSSIELSPTVVAWRNSDVLAWLGSSGAAGTDKVELSSEGVSRAKTILPFLPFTRTTLHEWSADGRFPSPVKLSPKVVAWRNSDVLAWLDSYGAAGTNKSKSEDKK